MFRCYQINTRKLSTNNIYTATFSKGMRSSFLRGGCSGGTHRHMITKQKLFH